MWKIYLIATIVLALAFTAVWFDFQAAKGNYDVLPLHFPYYDWGIVVLDFRNPALALEMFAIGFLCLMLYLNPRTRLFIPFFIVAVIIIYILDVQPASQEWVSEQLRSLG